MIEGLMYRSSKTYTHSTGLSCAFRQWRATHSHCSKLHGYALEVEIGFVAKTLDDKNWVVDFGGLKDVKAWLQEKFDHKTVISYDDPKLPIFEMLQREGLIDLVKMDGVGCEKFAEQIMDYVQVWVDTYPQHRGRVQCEYVIVKEHEGNSAQVIRPLAI